MLGEEYYITHFDRLLKHKSLNSIIQYAQNYFQLSLNRPETEADENYFSPQNISGDAMTG
jgi:hypothetical protein